MLYVLLTFGYLFLFWLYTYIWLGYRLKVGLKRPFIEVLKPAAQPPALTSTTTALTRPVSAAKGVGVGAIVSLCTVVGLVFFVDLPLIAELSGVVVGGVIGFVTAMLKYDRWTDVERVTEPPRQYRFTSKNLIRWAVTMSFGLTIYRRTVDALTSDAIGLLIMGAALLVVASLGLGFFAEQGLLFFLDRLNPHFIQVEEEQSDSR